MREQQLQTLHSLASESGATLSRVEYGHSNLEHLPGRRMTMQLTVQAEYPAYRKLLHNLLVAMPNLSIDRVTMERVPGQASRPNVRVEASLYYRNAAAGGASRSRVLFPSPCRAGCSAIRSRRTRSRRSRSCP